jgi:hypothetical protein
MRKIKSRSQGSVWKAVIASKLQKWGEAGLIHWPYRVNKAQRASYFNALGEVDPRDQPKKNDVNF